MYDWVVIKCNESTKQNNGFINRSFNPRVILKTNFF